MNLKFTHSTKAPDIYYRGWDELVSKGLHPSLSYYEEENLNHITVSFRDVVVGILSYWVDDMVKGSDANVIMIYVSPKYRKKGISKKLHEEFNRQCKVKSIKFISYAVNNKNKAMLAAQSKYKSCDKYTIFQYEV